MILCAIDNCLKFASWSFLLSFEYLIELNMIKCLSFCCYVKIVMKLDVCLKTCVFECIWMVWDWFLLDIHVVNYSLKSWFKRNIRGHSNMDPPLYQVYIFNHWRIPPPLLLLTVSLPYKMVIRGHSHISWHPIGEFCQHGVS